MAFLTTNVAALLITLVLIVLTAFLLAACRGDKNAASPTTQPARPTDTPVVQAADAPRPEPTVAPAMTSEPAREPEPTIEPLPVEERASAEGDNAPTSVEALLAAFPGTPEAQGEIVLLYGRVLDVNGDPLEGVSVEIWQTDVNGIYDHPGDPTTGDRDKAFQFYGTSVTDTTGVYAFRTILPGRYEPRPRHIHVKVKMDGAEVLTTQFYFDEDRADLAAEGLFAQAGDLGELLIAETVDRVILSGNPIRIMTNDLVVDTGIGAGARTLTPSQAEGPYYPVVPVAEYDSDLTIKSE